MRLASFVARLTMRTVLFGMVITGLCMVFLGIKPALSFAGGVALGIANGSLLKRWVEGIEGKSERAAKRAIRGGMAIRFLLIICTVSVGTYFLNMDIVPFVLGLMLFQLVGMMNIYGETKSPDNI